MENQEKKNSRIALILSISVHAIIALIAVFFIGCWKAPGPPWPNPVVGIEIDMGLDAVGSGEVKTDAPASEENLDTEEAQPEENETTEEVVEPTEPSEVTPTESTPVDQISDINTSDVNSDHHEYVTTPTPVTEPTPTPAEPVTEPKPAVTPATTPTIEPKDVVPTTSGSNNGDNIDEVGDKGNESSTTPSDTYSGDQKPGGGGGGVSFNVNGWKLDDDLTAKDELEDLKKREGLKSIKGQAKFRLYVDNDGGIRMTVESSNLSPQVVEILKKKIEALELTSTATDGRPPELTEGSLIWKLDSK